MKVKEAIKMLKNMNREDSIVLAFWEKDAFEGVVEKSEKDWPWVADRLSYDFDWSCTHDQLSFMVEKLLEED